MSNQIRDNVKERYSKIARKALEKNQASCCDKDMAACCAPDDAIPASALAALQDDAPLPAEIVETSLGCGTPLELAAPKPGEIVLDLGSGGGLDCFYAAKLVGASGHVIGVDMTSEMLALANANREKVGLQNVEFRKGFLEDLPVADESVDVIISNCVINLSADKDAVFREAHRVLKPGGRVVFSDIVARRALPAGLRKNMTSWSACISGAIPVDDYRAKMETAGFIGVNVMGEPRGWDLVYSAKILGRKE
jgi:SAM-dependent methyltransferase